MLLKNQSDSTILRIAITGPESTGKSTLAAQLATHYQTVFVPEFARYYLPYIQLPYQIQDLYHIALGQRAFEEALLPQAQQLLIADTEMLVLKVWYEHAFGESPQWLEDALKAQHYDLYLLMDIDIAWQPDPQREHPHLREHFLEIYHQLLEENQFSYKIISGNDEERLQNAISWIDAYKNLR